MVQKGKIGLNAPVSKFLPDYPNKRVAAVTVYRLLTHTGGTGDIFGPDFDANRSRLKTLEDYVALYGHRDLVFEPLLGSATFSNSPPRSAPTSCSMSITRSS